MQSKPYSKHKIQLRLHFKLNVKSLIALLIVFLKFLQIA